MRSKIDLRNRIHLLSITILLLLLPTCVSVFNERVIILSYRDNQKEYKELFSNLDKNEKHILSIEKDDFIEFLDEFNKRYKTLRSDYKLLEWYHFLNIGTDNDLVKAGKRLKKLIAINKDTFWRLNKKASTNRSDYELRQIKLWEDIFVRLPASSNREEIGKEIDKIEDHILKNPIQDIDSLEKQGDSYKKLFALRNEYARLEENKNHLYSVYSNDEITMFNKLYQEIKSNLANMYYCFKDMGGTIQSSNRMHFPLLLKTIENMGLYIEKEKVKYYTETDKINYHKTFMFITQPKNECRIHIFIPNNKMYPDHFLSFLESLFHETGHALHFQYIAQDPYIFHFHDPVITEMVAMFFETIIYSKEWLTFYFPYQLSEDDINTIINNRKSSLIYALQFATFMWEFETSVYENPNQDIEALYKTIHKNLKIKANTLSNLWYDTAVFASHDLYFTNYTLAYFYAFKLKNLVEKHFGERYFEDPSCGQFLIDNIFKYGRAIDRKELLTRLFGNTSLDIKEYIQFLKQ